MYYITNEKEIEETKKYMELAAKEAKKSTCKKSQRGVLIVRGGVLLSKGYNKPTLPELCNPCIRENIKDNSCVELCSAIHAEQMALLEVNNGLLKDARMYHIKVKDGKMKPSGDPSCTVCSRMVYEAGIEFVLWHEKGYAVYGPEEFNKISFDYFLKNKREGFKFF